MNDVNCPYCDAPQDICHDDGYGYEEDQIHEQECSNCEKVFAYRTCIILSYEAHKAECLNGAEHNFEPMHSFPNYFPDAKRCKDCGHEQRGEFDYASFPEFAPGKR